MKQDINIILTTGLHNLHSIGLHDVSVKDFHNTALENIRTNKRDNGETYLSGEINIGNISITLFTDIIS